MVNMHAPSYILWTYLYLANTIHQFDVWSVLCVS